LHHEQQSGWLAIGAPSDLKRRISEHTQGFIDGFTAKYRGTRPV